MKEHIQKRRKSTLVVNAVMLIETFIFGAYEGVSDVLRYLVDAYRYSLYVRLYTVQGHILHLAVFVFL